MTPAGSQTVTARSARIPLRGLLLVTPMVGDSAAPAFAPVREAALVAEETGFDGIWVADLLPDPGRPGAAAPFEAFSLLGALAQVTTACALGVLGSPADRRPPGVLAKIVTTLDALSGGRAVVALTAPASGTGDPAGVVAESIEAFRLVATGEPATLAGRHVRLAGAVSRPAAVYPEGIPIMVQADAEGLGAVARSSAVDGWVVDARGGAGPIGAPPVSVPVTLAVVDGGTGGDQGSLAASVRRARAAGFTGVVVAVDVTGPGGRERVQEAWRAVAG